MKRFLLVLLVAILMLSMTSCDIQRIINQYFPSQSDTSDDDYDDEEEEEEESSESQNESSTEKPSFSEDKNVYAPIASADNTVWSYSNYRLSAPTLTNYYHGYKAALSMTFDDGYDVATGHFVSDVFERYNFRGTAMLGPCFLNDSAIKEWNQIFDRGYLDLGCHGYNHENPETLSQDGYEHEIKDAIDFLKEKFPSQNVLTFATPLARITSSYESYLKELVIANRLEAAGAKVKLGAEFNPMRIRSYSFCKSQYSGSSLNSLVASNIKEGNWIVELLHCVLPNPQNSTDISRELFELHCKYLYDNHKDELWVASFEDVARYMLQLESTQITYTAADRESISFKLECSLDSKIYNIPMTVKVELPSFADSGYAIVNGEEQELEIYREGAKTMVNIYDIPVDGTEVKIVFGGNLTCNNGCKQHRFELDEMKDSTCHERGYISLRCSLCAFIYKTRYTPMTEHDFSEERVTEKLPTLTEKGLDTIKCVNCDDKKEIVTSYHNIARTVTLNAVDGYNQWVSVDSVRDGNDGTDWTNGEQLPCFEFTFGATKIDLVEILLSRYPKEWVEAGTTQSFTVSVFDGTEWKAIGSWEDGAETSEDNPVSVKIKVDSTVKGVKISFDKASNGCTKIKEIGIYAITEQEQ